MECVFGFIGGGGTALTFILTKPLFDEKIKLIDTNGLRSFIGNSTVITVLFVLYIIILAVDCVQYFVVPKDNDKYRKYMKICSLTEFSVYSIIPFMFILLGAHKIASTVAFTVVLLVLVQEFAEKFNKKGHTNPFGKIPLFIPVIAIFIICIINDSWLDLLSAMFIYTVIYETAFFGMKKLENGSTKLSPSEKTVHLYFTICCVLIMILTILIQGEIICLKT